MRNYNIRLLDSWLNSSVNSALTTFRPFPGKYPTRVFIRVYRTQSSNQPPYFSRRDVLFLYNGVPSPQAFLSYYAWKRRYCARFSTYDFSNLCVNFMEYHQNGIVLIGDFTRVQVNHHHLRIHLKSPFLIPDLGTRVYQTRSLGSNNFCPERERVVRCNGASFYVPDDLEPDVVNARIRARQRLMRAY